MTLAWKVFCSGMPGIVLLTNSAVEGCKKKPAGWPSFSWNRETEGAPSLCSLQGWAGHPPAHNDTAVFKIFNSSTEWFQNYISVEEEQPQH